jgi:hypothetical protein
MEMDHYQRAIGTITPANYNGTKMFCLTKVQNTQKYTKKSKNISVCFKFFFRKIHLNP